MKLGAWLIASSLLVACGGSTAGVDLLGATPKDPIVEPQPTDPDPIVDPPIACSAIAYACDPGDVQVSGPNDCQGLACYSRGTDTACTSQIWCAKNHEVTCDAVPTCEGDETAYQNGCPPGPVNSQCRKVTVCDSTIYCYKLVKPQK